MTQELLNTIKPIGKNYIFRTYLALIINHLELRDYAIDCKHSSIESLEKDNYIAYLTFKHDNYTALITTSTIARNLNDIEIVVRNEQNGAIEIDTCVNLRTLKSIKLK